MGSGRLIGVVVAAMTLSGCVATVGAPAPGLSDVEQAEFQQWQRDSQWQATGLPDELRPPDPPVELVSSEEWGDKFVSCMNDAGFDNYTAQPGGYSVEDHGLNDDEQLANFTCMHSYAVDAGDSYLLNHAQMDYWYDYFKADLIPCLANHDIPVFEAPTRAEFYDTFAGWHPYWAVRPKDQEFIGSNERLQLECPYSPPGYPQPGFSN
jgi:hypothetical protein